MQKRTFLTDTAVTSIDAPVPIIGLIVINATDKDCICYADNGDSFPAPALVISTWSLPPTSRIRAQLQGAPTNGKACNVIVTDEATLNSTSQLATLGGGSSVKFSHNGALVASETGLDFIDGSGKFTVTDDPANSKVTVTTQENELAYVEFTGQKFANGSGNASAVKVVSAGVLVFDGVERIKIEFFSAEYAASDNSNGIELWLFDSNNATPVGAILVVGSFRGQPNGAIHAVVYLTPSVGNHEYYVGITDAGAITALHASVWGGDATTLVPGFIRLTRVS